jgi:uncharacterized lipoprotein YddW (UPF0748 family)
MTIYSTNLKKICNIFFFFFLIVLFPLQLHGQSKEFRGVKLTDIDSPVLFSEKSISEAMDYLSSINVNAVIPVVWNAGFTQYPSKIIDSLFGFKIDPAFSGRDPLETVVIEAHRVGIEVYPWYEYGFASFYSGGTPPFGGHILQKFPQWASRHVNGDICTKNGFDWMSGINPEVQNLIIGITQEVLKNYDIDGIEYSDRMPALPVECGYDSATVALYKLDHNGVAPPNNYQDYAWKLWRATKLNDFYRRVRDSVKSLNPKVFVASSPSVYPWAYDEYLQDSKTWVNNGIVDQFLPQWYRYNFAEYMLELNNSLSQINPVKKEITFAGILMNVGSYTIDPQFLLQSLQANRQNGVKGEGFFFYEGLKRNNNKLGDTLKATYYNSPASMPGREFNRRPKGLLVNEDSSLVIKSGNWETLPVPGFRGGIVRTGTSQPSALEYNYEIPASAWYNLYVYLIPSVSFSNQVKYVVSTKYGDSTIIVNQQSPGKQGWYHLGSFEFDQGNRKLFQLSNSDIPVGKFVMSDAGLALIDRKKSPDVIVTSTDEKDIVSLSDGFQIFNNYPNPFNPTTTITYKTNEVANANIYIYNQLGELVDSYDLGEVSPGLHTWVWNATNLSSGPYFIKVSAGNSTAVIKTLLLK